MATVRNGIAQRGTQNQSFISTLRANTIILTNPNVSLGKDSGSYQQNTGAVAIGTNAGLSNQGTESVALGTNAGSRYQGDYCTAVGGMAGTFYQSGYGTGVGYAAGAFWQKSNTVAIGRDSAQLGQQENSIAIGNGAGFQVQGTNNIAIGYEAGYYNQGVLGVVPIPRTYPPQNPIIEDTIPGESIAIGYQAGRDRQNKRAIAIGYQAGFRFQGYASIAIGSYAGYTSQASNSIVINATDMSLNATNANALYIAPIRQSYQNKLLYYDTSTNEVTYESGGGGGSLPIATTFGQYIYYDGSQYSTSGSNNIKIGSNSGFITQGSNCIAIGFNAGQSSQRTGAIAIGLNAGAITQNNYALAIGAQAGQTNQGSYSVAIGYQAGRSNFPANSIYINASTIPKVPTRQNALYISPIRLDATTDALFAPLLHNVSTAEVFYNKDVILGGRNTGDVLDGMYGDGNDGYIFFDGYVTDNSLFSTFDYLTSTYTLTRDIYATAISIDSFITVITAGYRIFCTGTITNYGIIHNNGSNAVGRTAGAGGLGGFFKAGGAGTTGIAAGAVAANGPAQTAATANTLVGNFGGRGACAYNSTVTFEGLSLATSSASTPLSASGGRNIICSTSAWIASTLAPNSGSLYQFSPSLGGGAGAKSATGSAAASGGGGGGGGVVFIAAYDLQGTGLYQSIGGNGGDATGTGGNFGGGGGGAGGIIVLYTRSSVFSRMSSYFNVSGGNGGASVTNVATSNYSVAVAKGTTNTGLIQGVYEYLLPLTPTTIANINTMYLLSIHTSVTSGLRCAVTSVNGYISSGLDWYYVTTVDFSTYNRMELWVGYVTENQTGIDVMKDTNVRITFDLPPTLYRANIDCVQNTSVVNNVYPVIQSGTTTATAATAINCSLNTAPLATSMVYSVVARTGGTASVAGTGNTLVNAQNGVPPVVSMVSLGQQVNRMAWTTAADCGSISIEILQPFSMETGSKGWDGRIITLGI